MRKGKLILTLIAAVSMLFAIVPAGASAQEDPLQEADDGPRFRALVFSKWTNFNHTSRHAGKDLIADLADQYGFEAVIPEDDNDTSYFNDEDLATFDVVIWNNTNSTPQSGDLLDAEERAAFQRYIQAGGGFVGVHAATASERDWQWYEGLVGSIFTNHPPGQNPDGTIDGRIKVTDRVHPSTENLPELWEFEEEWYNWHQRLIGDVHVLAWIDTKVGISGLTHGPNHPFSWCHVYDGGRAWTTSGGHSAAAFSDADFVEHLHGGIEWAAGAAPGDCGATVEESFDKVLVADNPADPMALGFLSADEVVFVERGGAVKIVDQETLEMTTAGTIDVYTPDSDGLLGIAVDPQFAENRWIYVTYSHASEAQLQVSRFTLTENNALDMDSEEVLLEIPTYRGMNRAGVHMGGAMDFDADGNLYVGIGDNVDPFESDAYTPIDERPGRAHYDAQSTSANTADLRGKIIRITPQSDGTYTVPDDNLFVSGEWDHLFPGEAYDPELALPEIYAMGFRNPFRFTVDPVTGHVMVADHAPDARNDNPNRGPQAHGEWNVVTEAGNYGFPYCMGPNLPFVDYDFATGESGEPFDCDVPVNDSPNNTGLTDLPPAIGSDMWEKYGTTSEWPEFGTGGIAPNGGPVYRYDADLDSSTKFPEFYDGKWFIYEWDRRWIKQVSFLTEDQSFDRYPAVEAGEVLSVDPWGIDSTWVRPMDMRFGPDGALYVIEWGSNFGGNLRGQPNDDSGIYRVDYVAGDRPPIARVSADPTNGQAPLTVQFSSAGSGHPAGHSVTLHWDFGDGTTSDEADPVHTYTENGEYTARLTVTDDEDRSAIAVARIVVGNTRPEVTLQAPVNGGFFEFGDTVPYDIRVDDAEDGTTEDGTIDCEEVELLTLLGHDDHAHPLDSFYGCSGAVLTTTDGGHGEGQHLYYVLEAIYADHGGDGVGSLTGADAARLRTKFLEAEYFDSGEGVTRLARDTASGGVRLGDIRPGNWIAFDPVSFYGIDSVTIGASSGGQGGFLDLRRDAPDGELLGSVEVANTGNWDQVQELTLDLDGPHDSFALYIVARGPEDYNPGGPDLLALDWLEFHGEGVADDDDHPGCPDDEAERPERDDHFEDDELDRCRWDRIIRENPDDYWLADGRLHVNTTSGGNFGSNNQPPVENQFLQSVDPDDDWLIETKVDAPLDHRFQQAGLQYYQDDGTYVKLDVVADNLPGQERELRVELRSEIDDEPQQPQPNVQPAPENPDDEWWLRLAKEGDTFTGWVSVDGATWIEMPETVENDALADGAFGPIHQGRGQSAPVTVAFDYFLVDPEDEPAECPHPDERETVVVGGVDSGVPNRSAASGCTINDLILDEQPWPDQGAFMRHVREVTDELVDEEVIDGRERGAIVRAAARARV